MKRKFQIGQLCVCPACRQLHSAVYEAGFCSYHCRQSWAGRVQAERNHLAALARRHKCAYPPCSNLTHTGSDKYCSAACGGKHYSTMPECREKMRQMKLGKSNGPHSQTTKDAIRAGILRHLANKKALSASSIG